MLERLVRAPLQKVWELWTTPAGIESWWGPDGFLTRVTTLEVRAGGRFEYEMTAVDPAIAAALTGAGISASSVSRAEFVEVVRPERIVYRHRIDFIPGVPAYEVLHAVEFREEPGGVRVTVRLQAMHDRSWTDRSVTGYRQQLARLARAAGPRAPDRGGVAPGKR